eukprot:1853286-Prymnesium_polylepis.1
MNESDTRGAQQCATCKAVVLYGPLVRPSPVSPARASLARPCRRPTPTAIARGEGRKGAPFQDVRIALKGTSTSTSCSSGAISAPVATG